jgi:4'-phosphopantetheinyl transferase
MLHASDRARWSALRRSADKARFATGRALARSAIVASTEMSPDAIAFSTLCPRCGAQHGKPYLPDSEIEFSLSHAGDLVVLAMTRGVALGVDVERVIPSSPDLAGDVLTESEQRVLRDQPPGARAHAFFTYWTRKEALLKATGEGLITPMTTIEVSAPHDPAAVLTWNPSSPDGVQLVDLRPDSGYAAALAALTGEAVAITDHGAVDPVAPLARPTHACGERASSTGKASRS